MTTAVESRSLRTFSVRKPLEDNRETEVGEGYQFSNGVVVVWWDEGVAGADPNGGTLTAYLTVDTLLEGISPDGWSLVWGV
ncbi:hypothetical protein [Longispora urticae]